MSSAKIKKYASLRGSIWGSGVFADLPERPDPYPVLSDETRFAIISLLCLRGPLTAKQIADELDLSPSAVLDHLRKLEEAMIIKEVEVSEKKYKRERYYDVDIVPYFEDEKEEVYNRISKYTDILRQTTLAVFEKCLEEVADYLKNSLMAKHGMNIERDDVKHFIFEQIWESIGRYFYEKNIYKDPFQTDRKYYLYVGLKRYEGQH